MSDGETNLVSVGLIGGAVIKALLDHLVQKGVLTVPEVHDVLKAAYKDILSHEGQTVAGLHAEHLLSLLSRHFTESGGFKESGEAAKSETLAEYRGSEKMTLEVEELQVALVSDDGD